MRSLESKRYYFVNVFSYIKQINLTLKVDIIPCKGNTFLFNNKHFHKIISYFLKHISSLPSSDISCIIQLNTYNYSIPINFTASYNVSVPPPSVFLSSSEASSVAFHVHIYQETARADPCRASPSREASSRRLSASSHADGAAAIPTGGEYR